MATLAEKLRACAVLGGFGAVDVEDSDGDQREVLTLSGDDLKTIADALDERDERHGRAVAAEKRVAELEVRLAERPADSRPVAWWLAGPSPSATTNASEAQRHSDAGKHVAPLYVHPPAPEPLPSREDLETVLRETARLGDVPLGDAVALAEDDGAFSVYDPKQEAEGLTFAEAVSKAAAILRAKKAEG